MNNNDDDVVISITYDVNICGKITQIITSDPIEAATLAIEHYRKIQENFDIGTIIHVTEVESKKCYYIVAELALANAGLYREAKQLNDIAKQLKKKKK